VCYCISSLQALGADLDLTGSVSSRSADYPVWSPDGRWVLFDRFRGGNIWLLEGVEACGAGPHPVTIVPGDVPEEWHRASTFG
jgi:hypothetical protein